MKEFDHIFLIGVGGIGMSALARYFKAQGKVVTGYDRTATALTDRLVNEGVEVFFEDDSSFIPAEIKQNKDRSLIIVTPAIPLSNRLMNWFVQREFKMTKRAFVLGEIANAARGIAVAGTHGKTTTTSILAHLLTHSGKGCNAFLGGISSNYDTNVLIDSKSNLCVIEADEFDRSFHQLCPEIAVITNVDPDHLDIYGSEAEFKNAFSEFANGVKQNGTLIIHESIEMKEIEGVQMLRYGFDTSCDIRAHDVQVKDGMFTFEMSVKSVEMGRFVMPLPGRHNILNALAALAVCVELDVDMEKLKAALAKFKGVKRRFEFHIRTEGLVYIDDYAHHPSEIRACVSSVRELFPGKRVTGVFQPHLFSRTKDFMSGFAESLSELDELILLDIYPAREMPIEGVNSEALLEQTPLANKMLCTKEALIGQILGRDLEILLTLGAGDIDKLVAPLKEGLYSTI